MSDSPLRSLVGRLAPFRREPGIIDTSEAYLSLFGDAGAVGAEALSGSGVGLDHFAGERVLASMLTRDTPKGYEHRLACAITDRRLAVGGYSSTTGGFNGFHWAIPWTELQRVDVHTSLLKTKIVLHAGGQARDLPVGELVSKVGPALEAIATQIPPEQRVEPPTPFVEPSAEDPSGAAGAAAGLWVDDPRARALLERVDGAVRAGEMDAGAGEDMARRVLVAHRARCGGPGMLEGTWTCAMSAQDLGHTLVRVFGAPLQHTRPQPGIDALRFRIDPRRDALGAALNGLGLASYLVLGVGFSPGKLIAGALLKRQPVTQMDVLFTDRPGHCRYRVQARGTGLEQPDAMLAHRFHQAMIGLSYAVLERRCQYGWQASFEQIMA